MRLLRRLLVALLALIVLLLGVGFVWALNPSPVEPAALQSAEARPGVRIEPVGQFIVLTPADKEADTGILFYPGMHVASEAYIPKLAAIVEAAGVGVVIGRPPLAMAFLAIDQADEMRPLLPEVEHWYMAGHSMGGATACLYTQSHQDAFDGVILLGTYCGSDLSTSGLRVLSIAGGNDGLFPPESIDSKRFELPPGAVMETVAGMNHAQFANYGPQFGDRPAAIGDDEALEAITSRVAAFLGQGT